MHSLASVIICFVVITFVSLRREPDEAFMAGHLISSVGPFVLDVKRLQQLGPRTPRECYIEAADRIDKIKRAASTGYPPRGV